MRSHAGAITVIHRCKSKRQQSSWPMVPEWRSDSLMTRMWLIMRKCDCDGVGTGAVKSLKKFSYSPSWHVGDIAQLGVFGARRGAISQLALALMTGGCDHELC
ncbi:hypothetical protein LSUCC0031_07470 [Rhodobacterales bacterium LSUCC0031]|nr:hypothetical protein [Rhodobacterales bacterium LSUCC0031]